MACGEATATPEGETISTEAVHSVPEEGPSLPQICDNNHDCRRQLLRDIMRGVSHQQLSELHTKYATQINDIYTTAVLRGRHPRSFRSERGIYQYLKDSNQRANMRQKGHGYHFNADSVSTLSFGTLHSSSELQHSSSSLPNGNPQQGYVNMSLDHSHSWTAGDTNCPSQRQGASNFRRPQTQVDTTKNSNSQVPSPKMAASASVSMSAYKRRGVRRPRAATSQGRKRPTTGPGIGGLLGGYLVQRGGVASSYRGVGDSDHFLGGDGQGGDGGRGSGHVGSQGRANERPVTVHQRFNAMVGVQREASTREEEQKAHLLDSFNDDPSLKLHYGLHITLQAVQGESGSFVALDMDTGEVTMRQLHAMQKNQQLTFKLVDLEEPESYRSILYGSSVWLQIIPGPGEPTWKQGGVLGVRVHGPGALPTVGIDANGKVPAPTAGGAGGSRPNTTGSTASTGNQRSTTSVASASPGSNSFDPPGSSTGVTSGGWAEATCVPGGGGVCGGNGNGGNGVAGSRVRSAVGGGNTDEHRQVGIPYPFKAAASKQGDHGGGTNETVLRLMNKSALVNCRWTIRPVLPDGQSVPAKAGGEVSNMDYVYLEQDFFYMTRVSQSRSVVLKALQHGPRLSGGAGKGRRRPVRKQYPVERRGIFQMQVADTDELRPGEERSAALMRKAKRGLKRSEARRGGHRTYVHKDRPQDRLTSGAAFPRDIRVRTTHFAADSETKAILRARSTSGRSPASIGNGDGDMYKGRYRGAVAPPPTWIPTASWGTKILQAMSDVARAPVNDRVAANHSRVLRQWRQRWDKHCSSGSYALLASDHTNRDHDELRHRSSTDDGIEGSSNDTDSERELYSPMCARCRTLEVSSSARLMLGRYCLCAVNQEIQREVGLGSVGPDSNNANRLHQQSAHQNSEASHAEALEFIKGDGTRASTLGPGRPSSPAVSAKSSAETNAGDPPGCVERLTRQGVGENVCTTPRPGSPETRGGGGSGGGASGRQGCFTPGEERGVLPHAVSGIDVGGTPLSATVGSTLGSTAGGVGGGLKRARDRRADRRRKKDPLEALEARLLDGFSLESITRQLERQDEILLKGVRHVERMRARREDRGRRRSGDELGRVIAKKRFEVLTGDPMPGVVPTP